MVKRLSNSGRNISLLYTAHIVRYIFPKKPLPISERGVLYATSGGTKGARCRWWYCRACCSDRFAARRHRCHRVRACQRTAGGGCRAFTVGQRHSSLTKDRIKRAASLDWEAAAAPVYSLLARGYPF